MGIDHSEFSDTLPPVWRLMRNADGRVSRWNPGENRLGPTPGDKMPDGSIYAGISPETGDNFYIWREGRISGRFVNERGQSNFRRPEEGERRFQILNIATQKGKAGFSIGLGDEPDEGTVESVRVKPDSPKPGGAG